jgi:hypothetical protein
VKNAIVVLAAAALAAVAQEIRFPPSFEKLAAKAEETVDVTLDASLLQLGSKFLSSHDPEQAKAKKLASGLKGVYVRSFQFAKEGEYTDADIEGIRSQLSGPGWSRIVNVRSKKEGETAEVFIKKEGDQIVGLTVVAAEPKELTVANIVGPINPEDLAALGGQFGVPKVEVERKAPPKKETK